MSGSLYRPAGDTSRRIMANDKVLELHDNAKALEAYCKERNGNEVQGLVDRDRADGSRLHQGTGAGSGERAQIGQGPAKFKDLGYHNTPLSQL